MKKHMHPESHPVVFRDPSTGFAFLTRSTVTSSKSIKWEDGNTYPLVEVDVSSESHPFYTGRGRIVDSAGRVQQFKRRYGQ